MTNRSRQTAPTAIELDTEQKILVAARFEFAERGVEGARMQAIADRAGVNKALLHYYFRSKEKLFQLVFKDMAHALWHDVRAITERDGEAADLRALIGSLVTAYITTFAANPEIPRMLMHELAAGGVHMEGVVEEVMSVMGNLTSTLISLVKKEHGSGRIRRFEPVHLMMNIIGMCIATFFFQPVARAIESKRGKFIEFDRAFYQKRVDIIVETVCDGIFAKGKKQ